MNKLLIALMVFSANSFALSEYELNKMDQDFRINQLEQKYDEMEYQKHLDENERFFEELHEKITRVG